MDSDGNLTKNWHTDPKRCYSTAENSVNISGAAWSFMPFQQEKKCTFKYGIFYTYRDLKTPSDTAKHIIMLDSCLTGK